MFRKRQKERHQAMKIRNHRQRESHQDQHQILQQASIVDREAEVNRIVMNETQRVEVLTRCAKKI